MNREAINHLHVLNAKISALYNELRSNTDVWNKLGDELRALEYALEVADSAILHNINEDA